MQKSDLIYRSTSPCQPSAPPTHHCLLVPADNDAKVAVLLVPHHLAHHVLQRGRSVSARILRLGKVDLLHEVGDDLVGGRGGLDHGGVPARRLGYGLSASVVLRGLSFRSSAGRERSAVLSHAHTHTHNFLFCRSNINTHTYTHNWHSHQHSHLPLNPQTHTHTAHTRMHARTHARIHARTHARTHTPGTHTHPHRHTHAHTYTHNTHMHRPTHSPTPTHLPSLPPALF